MILVLCTTNSKDSAKHIATHLVNNRLAACVNIIPNVLSVYQWKGNVETDEEFLLLIKTREVLYEKLEKEIVKLHPYETPEIISFDISKGLPEYLKWAEKETNSLF